MPRYPVPPRAEGSRRKRRWWRLFTLFLSLLICCGTYYHLAFRDSPIRFYTPWHYERVEQRQVTVPYHTPVPVRKISLPLKTDAAPTP